MKPRTSFMLPPQLTLVLPISSIYAIFETAVSKSIINANTIFEYFETLNSITVFHSLCWNEEKIMASLINRLVQKNIDDLLLTMSIIGDFYIND